MGPPSKQPRVEKHLSPRKRLELMKRNGIQSIDFGPHVYQNAAQSFSLLFTEEFMRWMAKRAQQKIPAINLMSEKKSKKKIEKTPKPKKSRRTTTRRRAMASRSKR